MVESSRGCFEFSSQLSSLFFDSSSHNSFFSHSLTHRPGLSPRLFCSLTRTKARRRSSTALSPRPPLARAKNQEQEEAPLASVERKKTTTMAAEVVKRLDFAAVSLHPDDGGDPLLATGGRGDVKLALEEPSVENFKR